MDGRDQDDLYVFHEDGWASPLSFDSTESTLILFNAGGVAPDVGNALLADVADIESDEETEAEDAEEAPSSESESEGELEIEDLHNNLAPLDEPLEVDIPEALRIDNLVWDLDDPSTDSGYTSP
ncbi:unnamed protein product [Acanthoscelides obtectus]|uniref:Uncharacterized protein n=1 Tax=Acanthoscelides obtectus TaxID=200917 RepID=A0A9P0P5G7_ACAOB|nr:unnamed protein product [Acanthoscelides obtectus]CAH1969495.1 unnamed protein product [Acanthoscelides obtectus]CAK1622955.1 hypothetical protein AOBTE_LOCUS1746 [Acanthoscelides obtectus]CAK1622956.1 hypothetical protein AOBTE_LOCUS1747 [Acanthoscelides obtectus]